MYLIKYIFLFISGVYGQQCFAQQSFVARQTTDFYEKKLPSSNETEMVLRFESLQKFTENHPKLKRWIQDAVGQFECRLKLSLRKEKVLAVHLFFVDAKYLGKRLRWQQRRLLKRCFRQLDFIVQIKTSESSPKLPKYYKTSCLFRIENGEMKYL